MPKRGKKRVQIQAEDDSGSDDEIGRFHKEREKILLDNEKDVSVSEEEEVYPLVDSDSDDDDEELAFVKQQLRQQKRNNLKKKMDSDLEDDPEDRDLPDSRAWGSKRSWFYGGDVRDNKIILSGSEGEEGNAALEEKEAMEIQKRRIALMTEEDFMIPASSKTKTELEKKKKKKGKKHEETVEVEQLRWQTEDVDPTNKKSENISEKRKKKKNKKEQEAIEDGGDLFEKVQTDFSQMSRDEELKVMMRLHPEYVPLVNDFRNKAKELRERIIPLMVLMKKGQITGIGAEYLRMKYHIINTYLMNGYFYMYFMAKRMPNIHHHPVMGRLVEYQNFYNRLKHVDETVKESVDEVLGCLKRGEEVGQVLTLVWPQGAHQTSLTWDEMDVKDGVIDLRKKKLQLGGDATRKKRKQRNDDNDGRLDTSEMDDATQQKRKRKAQQDDAPRKKGKTDIQEEASDDDEDEQTMALHRMEDEDKDNEEDNEEGDERRAITYQMEKNKGLMAHKKKEARNPRVKHRTKYRRAMIRRKGQVRSFKPPKQPYRGEPTGIRAGIIRSRKLK